MKLGKIVTMVYYIRNHRKMYLSQFSLNLLKVDIFGTTKL